MVRVCFSDVLPNIPAFNILNYQNLVLVMHGTVKIFTLSVVSADSK